MPNGIQTHRSLSRPFRLLPCSRLSTDYDYFFRISPHGLRRLHLNLRYDGDTKLGSETVFAEIRPDLKSKSRRPGSILKSTVYEMPTEKRRLSGIGVEVLEEVAAWPHRFQMEMRNFGRNMIFWPKSDSHIFVVF